MDVYSSNRSRLNTERIQRIDEKSIVFIVAAPLTGNSSDEIEFPYDGVLRRVSMSCKVTGTTQTELMLQRCKATEYVTTSPVWEDLLATPLILSVDEKVANVTIDSTVRIQNGDFMRIFFNSAGSTALNFVVRADIELNIEN